MKTFLSKYKIKNIIVEIITSNRHFISFSLEMKKDLKEGTALLKNIFKQKNFITEICLYKIDNLKLDKVAHFPLVLGRSLLGYNKIAEAKNLQIDSMEALEKKMDSLMGEALLKNI